MTQRKAAAKVVLRLQKPVWEGPGWYHFRPISQSTHAMLVEGVPAFIRSDNGPEMVVKVLRKWLSVLGANSLHIEPCSPWENGYCQSFNGKCRGELLNGEIFCSLREAMVVIKQWRIYYNT